MGKKNIIISSAIASVLALAAAPAAMADMATPDGMEKCYGIAKKGMNDCGTAGASCAGSAVKDNQGDAFLLMPAGLCQRIVGGSLTKK